MSDWHDDDGDGFWEDCAECESTAGLISNIFWDFDIEPNGKPLATLRQHIDRLHQLLTDMGLDPNMDYNSEDLRIIRTHVEELRPYGYRKESSP